MNDEEHENKINEAFMRLQFSNNPKDRRLALNDLESLVKQRSPEQIAKMEAWVDGSEGAQNE
jgi:hypothetical protein